jgi:hypothetical protein
MALLDLQGMEIAHDRKPPPGSRASKGCGGGGGGSRLSLAIC